MNKVLQCGRLTGDPETRQSGDIAVVKFRIAVDRKYKREGEPTADFMNCTAFGKLGEVIGQHFSKGNKILVTGRIATNNYTDKDGNKRSGWEIIVEDFDFCESKSGKTNDTSSDYEKVEGEVTAELPF